MGAIPLPELALQGVSPNGGQQYSNMLALRSGLQTQALQQQGMQQENQLRQIQLNDQQAMSEAMREWDGQKMEDLPGLMIKHGASANAVMGMKTNLLDYQVKLAGLNKEQLTNLGTQNDLIAGHIEALKQLPPDQQAVQFPNAIADLVKKGAMSPQEAQGLTYQGPDQLDYLEKMHTAHTAQVEQALKTAQTGQAQQAEQASEATEEETRLKTQLMQQYGTPEQQQARYIKLQQQKNQGIPVAPPDQAFMGAYEKFKTLVPTATFNLQNAGLTGSAGQPSAIAKGLADGSIKWGDVVSARTPMSVKQQLLSEVKQLKPDFNSGDFEVEQAVKRQATSGSVGQSLLGIATAREHMKTFNQLADALDNNDVQALNRLGNAIGVQFGSDKKTNFQIAAQAFGGEVGRAFDGAGVIGAEREQAQNNFNAAMSKGQFKGAIQTVDALLAGKQKAAHEWFDKGTQAQPNFGNTPTQPKATQGGTFSWDNMPQHQ